MTIYGPAPRRHTLSPGSEMGAITHMWSTACGANANKDEFGVNSGVLVYKVYVGLAPP